MRLLRVSLILFSSSAFAATVTGTVKGPDGAPFEGAFVQAVNAKTKISVSVLSDKQGRYRVENLPAGEYQVRVRAVGFTTDPAQRREPLPPTRIFPLNLR